MQKNKQLCSFPIKQIDSKMPPKTIFWNMTMRNTNYWISIAITQDVLTLQNVNSTILFFFSRNLNLFIIELKKFLLLREIGFEKY